MDNMARAHIIVDAVWCLLLISFFPMLRHCWSHTIQSFAFPLFHHEHINVHHHHSLEVCHISHSPSFETYGLELLNGGNTMIVGCWAQLIGTLNCLGDLSGVDRILSNAVLRDPQIMKNSNSKSFLPVCCQAALNGVPIIFLFL